MSFRKTLGFLVFLLCLQLSYSQSSLPEGMEKVASVEGITEYRLDNGLRVLLFPDPSKPTITVNVTYLVGSRHEGYGETGMAHLLEHMVFKGSPRHPDIPQELTERGASPNGTTWYDRTNYFETFNATEDNLRWALDLESDRMVNSFIRAEDLESEMTVVRNEFEAGENDPSGVLLERVLSTAYLWHNYGKSTIGARSDLENVPVERLRAFYRKYYQPDNAVLTIAGKIDEELTLKLVHEYFSPIPRPERELYPTYTREPTQDGERMVTLRRTGDVQVASVAYHIPPGSHPDYAAVAVLEELLTSEPSGRLYQALVNTKKAAYQWGWASSLREAGFAYFSAEVLKDKSVEAASQAMIATLDSLKVNPPTGEEVERAKKRLLKYNEMMFKDSRRVGLRMSEYIAQGDWRLAYIYRDNLEAVTAEDVARVAREYFKPSNRTLGFFYPTPQPDRAEIPEAPNVESLVSNYKGREAIAQGEDFDPSPANIDARTTIGEANIEYALLAKETRGDAVTARMVFRLGDANSLKNQHMASRFAVQMLDKGTEHYSRQEIEDELDRLKASVRFYGSGSSVVAIITTEREYLPEVIELTAEMLKRPTFPEDEFEKMKEEQLASLDQQRSEPQAVASRTFSRTLNPYDKEDIRYSMTFDEEAAAIEKLSLEEVKAFYGKHYGASDATLAVVGDFDEQQIKGLLRKEFSDWKSSQPYTRMPRKPMNVKAGLQMLETPDKANAMFLAGQTFALRDDHPDYPALVLGNFMLGGGFLNSRLATRIRQEEGISYGVGSGFYASPLDEYASFTTYAIYAPENAARLQKAFREEIENVRKEGFTAEEVEAAKSGWLQRQVVRRSQDRSLASELETNLYLDRTMAWDAGLEEKIQTLTPEEIHDAMKKYIDADRMVMVLAGDFARAETEGKP